MCSLFNHELIKYFGEFKLFTENNLNNALDSISFISESAYLARMNWWTVEYGLIGDISNPKIYGAGLLSSIGESENCLTDKVKKLPISIDCINFEAVFITQFFF